jgi:hypothetical protein
MASLFASCWSTHKWNSMSIQHQHYSFCFWILPSLVPVCDLWPLLEFCDPWQSWVSIYFYKFHVSKLNAFLNLCLFCITCVSQLVLTLFYIVKFHGKATSPLLPRHVECSEILKVVKVEVLWRFVEASWTLRSYCNSNFSQSSIIC